MHSRSTAIDCLRAFAIMWVVYYHFVPLRIFDRGTHAVLLFFIISGYCIAISAKHSDSAWHFYAKRIGRLMPALIVCSLITVTAKNLWPRLIAPDRIVSFRDAAESWFGLPTLNVFNLGYHLPDGAYWSLIVEFKFYAVVAVAMAIGCRRAAIPVACIYMIIRLLLNNVWRTPDIDFFSFFISGLSIAAWREGDRVRALTGWAFATTVECLLLWLGHSQPSVPLEPLRLLTLVVGTIAVFAGLMVKIPHRLNKALRPVTYVGLISYPIYLLHQDLGHMLLNYYHLQIGTTYSNLVGFAVVPFVFILLAALINRFVERPFIGRLTDALYLGMATVRKSFRVRESTEPAKASAE